MTEAKAKRPYNKRMPMTPNVEPAPGQKWVCRDPRDKGRLVAVMELSADGFVTLESDTGRRSQIRRERFVKNYSFDPSKQ